MTTPGAFFSHQDIQNLYRLYIPKEKLLDPGYDNGETGVELPKEILISRFQNDYCPHIRLNEGNWQVNEALVLRSQWDVSLTKKITSVMTANKMEDSLNNISSEGGTYQTLTDGSLLTIAKIIRKMISVTSDDVIIDLGAGQNRPAFIFANLLGCRAIGIEIDRERYLLAAYSAWRVFKDDSIPLKSHRVGLLNCDACKPVNLSGIKVFFLWDSAFNDETTYGMQQNIGE